MIWSRLKNMKCPKCNTDMQKLPSPMYQCKNQKCGMTIGEEKFNKIVTDLYQGRKVFEADEVTKHLSGINNMEI